MISDLKPRVRPTPPKRRRRRATMLQPQAYDENVMPSLKLARTSRFARRVGKVLLALLGLWLVAALFVPWQQSVRGSGDVIGYKPSDRPQTIEAPIKGRIIRLGDGLVENARVSKGDVIAEIQDLDKSYLARLESQLDAKEIKVQSLENLVEANGRNLAAARTVAQTLRTQLATYRSVKNQTVAAAAAAVESAANKVEAMKSQLAEHQATLVQVKQDYERQQILNEEEIASDLKLQEAERKLRETQAKVEKAKSDVKSAEADLEEKKSDREAKADKAQVDIEYASAMLEKAQGEIAKSESEISKAESDLQTAQSDLLDAEAKLSRQAEQTIRAPFDGIVTQITPNLESQMLKPGDPVCVIVPNTQQLAVQILLDGNDATLVEPGRHVRLQFEGWPAVQFAGWPSVAVGTFGGEIASVDAMDNGKGQFRVLILPDETDQPWPEGRYLRQGVRANGWVLLDQVPLWYEIWRRMNGFPPVVDTAAPDSKPVKTPKLPKA